MARRVTICDVAKVSGVSPATVSRVISGSPLVKDRLRNKVLQVARNVGYPISLSAHGAPSLISERASKPSLHLEVFVFSRVKLKDFPVGDFYKQVLHGIQTEALHRLNAQVSMQSYSQPRLDSRILDELSQRDGVILIGAIDKYPDCLEQLLEMDIPVVIAGREVPGKTLNCVNSEIIPGCRELTNHLLEKGFRRFGWLGVHGAAHHIEERLAHIRGLLITKGIQIHPRDCRYAKECTPKDVLECSDQWISEGDLPEVIICPAGFMVTCLQRSLASFDKSCPEDLSIACFNDHHNSDIYHPEPMCISGFPEEIGRRAYCRLLELIQNPRERSRPEVIMIPMQFSEGGSVRPPKR